MRRLLPIAHRKSYGVFAQRAARAILDLTETLRQCSAFRARPMRIPLNELSTMQPPHCAKERETGVSSPTETARTSGICDAYDSCGRLPGIRVGDLKHPRQRERSHDAQPKHLHR